MPPRFLVLCLNPSLCLDLNLCLRALVLSNLLDCCPLLLLSNVGLKTLRFKAIKHILDCIKGYCDFITCS